MLEYAYFGFGMGMALAMIEDKILFRGWKVDKNPPRQLTTFELALFILGVGLGWPLYFTRVSNRFLRESRKDGKIRRL